MNNGLVITQLAQRTGNVSDETTNPRRYLRKWSTLRKSPLVLQKDKSVADDLRYVNMSSP